MSHHQESYSGREMTGEKRKWYPPNIRGRRYATPFTTRRCTGTYEWQQRGKRPRLTSKHERNCRDPNPRRTHQEHSDQPQGSRRANFLTIVDHLQRSPDPPGTDEEYNDQPQGSRRATCSTNADRLQRSPNPVRIKEESNEQPERSQMRENLSPREDQFHLENEMRRISKEVFQEEFGKFRETLRNQTPLNSEAYIEERYHANDNRRGYYSASQNRGESSLLRDKNQGY